MADLDLDALKAAALAAQRGPWIVDANFTGKNWLVCSTGTASDGKSYHVTTDGLHASESNGADAKDDAEFIATANPATILALVERVRRLEAVAAAARSLLGEMHVRTDAIHASIDHAAAAWSAAKRDAEECTQELHACAKQRATLLTERDAAVRERDELRETVSVQQQLIDSIIVACGSLGLMQSELPKHVADLRARLAAAEREKHAWAAKCMREWLGSLGADIRDYIEREEAAAKANGEVGNG